MTSRKRAISQTHEKFTSFSPYLTVGSIERIVAPKPSEHIFIVRIILCIILKNCVGAECLVLKKLIGNTKFFFSFDTSKNKIKKTSDPFVINKLKIL